MAEITNFEFINNEWVKQPTLDGIAAITYSYDTSNPNGVPSVTDKPVVLTEQEHIADETSRSCIVWENCEPVEPLDLAKIDLPADIEAMAGRQTICGSSLHRILTGAMGRD